MRHGVFQVDRIGTMQVDAMVLKVRKGGQVRPQSALIAIGVNMRGYREVLGFWIGDSETYGSWNDFSGIESDCGRPTNYNRPPPRGVRHVLHISPPEGFLQKGKDLTCKEREDLKQSGVYFSFGISDDIGENIVYIGQAGARKNGEGILYRLQEYKRDEKKNYWTEAVGFTTSNNSFGPTEISYLEHRFFNLVEDAKRYNVKNNVDPTSGHVTEEKESEPIENNED